MRTEAQAWWDQAEPELKGARHLLESGDYHLCAFLCQQAVEMGLKGLWIYRRKQMPPKTDLTELAAGVDVPQRLESLLRDLNPLFATTRYPDAANGIPVRMYDERIAGERLRDAEEVMAWCRNELELS